jgi:DNA-binding transcriptional regulator YdaS (Cro superfamily)
MTDEQALREAGEALFGSRWQSDLARLLGVLDVRVRDWQAGRRPVPADVWAPLARALKDNAKKSERLAEKIADRCWLIRSSGLNIDHQQGEADMDESTFNSIKIGETIHSVDGHGSPRVSTVVGKVTDRWGRHLQIKFQDGTEDTVHSFTKVGIGHYRAAA